MIEPKLIPNGDGLPGRIEYFKKKNIPLVISLTGNGPEDGRNDGGSGTDSALLKFLQSSKSIHPHIARIQEAFDINFVTPQTSGGWLDGIQLIRFLEYCDEEFQPSGVCIIGYSAGGGSAWKAMFNQCHPKTEISAPYKNRIKCVIPICGRFSLYSNFDNLDVGIWAFHGSNDRNVWPNVTAFNCGFCSGDKRLFFNELSLPDGPGHNAKYVSDNVAMTLFHGKGHSIQSDVYAYDEVWQYVYDNCRSTSTAPPPEETENRFKDWSNEELTQLITFIGFTGSTLDDSQMQDLQLEVDKRLPELIQKISI